MWQTPSLWGSHSPVPFFPVVCGTYLYNSHHSANQNTAILEATGRWWEGQSRASLTAPQFSSLRPLPDPPSFSTQEHWGSGRSQGRTVHLSGSNYATHFSGSVNPCQVGVITTLQREEMTTRSRSEWPRVLSLFPNKTRTLYSSLPCDTCRGWAILGREVRSHNFLSVRHPLVAKMRIIINTGICYTIISTLV